MPFVGHLPELFFLLVLALIVFGPKRMIEMGSSLGKALREVRDQLKDVPGMSGVANLGGLLGDDEPRRTPFSTMSQFSQSVGVELRDDEAPANEARMVEAPAAPPELTGASALARAASGGLGANAGGVDAAAPSAVVEGSVERVEPVEQGEPRAQE